MKNKYQVYRSIQQQGIVLIIALILMVVMALSAVVAIRTSGLDETINNNTRQRVLAMQAAEAGINYCRQKAFKEDPSFNIIKVSDFTDPGENWKNADSWSSANVVSSTDLGDINNYTKKPLCIVENISEYIDAIKPDTTRRAVTYRITARGFSPNYVEGDGNKQTVGAQVWLQVMVGRVIK